MEHALMPGCTALGCRGMYSSAPCGNPCPSSRPKAQRAGTQHQAPTSTNKRGISCGTQGTRISVGWVHYIPQAQPTTYKKHTRKEGVAKQQQQVRICWQGTLRASTTGDLRLWFLLCCGCGYGNDSYQLGLSLYQRVRATSTHDDGWGGGKWAGDRG